VVGSSTGASVAANGGPETISIESTGAANRIASIDDNGEDDLRTLTITGDQDLRIDAIGSTVTTIDASGAVSGCDIDITTTNADGNNLTITGGAGNDTIRSSNLSTSDTIDLGDGDADTVEVNVSTTTGGLSGSLTSVETASLNTSGAATTATIDLNNAQSITSITITNTATGLVTLSGSNLPPAPSITLSTTPNVTLSGANIFRLKSGTGTGDAGTLNFAGNGTVNITGAFTTSASATDALEILTINGTGGAITFGVDDALDGGGHDKFEKLILTGGAGVTVSNEIVDSVTFVELDGSALTGSLTMTDFANNEAAAITLKSGSGNDTLLGGDDADTLSSGTGNDTLIGGEGADNLTTGTGNDVISLDDSATTTATIDTCTDCDLGTSSTAVDTITLDLTETEGLTVVTDLVDTNANSTAGGGAMTYAALSADGGTVANADIVGIIGDYADAAAALAAKTSWTIVYGAVLADNDAFFIAYTSGANVRIAVVVETGANANSDTIDSVTDLLVLNNVSLSNLDSTDFNAIGN
jgi:hypothetical protein